MVAKADQNVLLETMAASQNQGTKTDGTGRAQEIRDHDGSQ